MAPLPLPVSPLAHLPHPAYAEDQPWSKTILAVHVLHRGYQAGAIVGAVLTPIFYIRNGKVSQRAIPPLPRLPFTTILLRSTGAGVVSGTALLAVGLVARMNGREHIEWQDRSWRLLENKGQMETDEFSIIGTTAAAAALAMKMVKPVGMRATLGTLGLGNAAGVMTYMAWRYGVKGGKWED